MSEAFKVADLLHITPMVVTTVWACVVLLISALSNKATLRLGPISVFGIILALISCFFSWAQHPEAVTGLFGGMVVVDRFAIFLDVLFLIGALLSTLMASDFIREHRFTDGEFFGLLLLSVVGMMVMAHSADFVVMVIGLETMSLAVYCMVASWTERRRSPEAGIKYFIMGAVASAFLLYGIALLYGVSGETGYAALSAKAPALGGDPLFVVGMLMILAALGFKVALVPFHMWTPDAYEGAPTPVTAFMAAAVKAAGFGVLLRILAGAFSDDFLTYGSSGSGWANVFWTLSVLTMTVGNFVALRQNNIKRMLAYSSVAHAGYLLIGVISGIGDPSAVLFYLLQYGATTLGAFGVVIWVGNRQSERLDLEDWAGLADRQPLAAAMMTLFMASLGGIPPTAGFFAKLYLFKNALAHPVAEGMGIGGNGLLLLVLIAVFNSVVSMFYYLRPVVAMYFREPLSQPDGKPLMSGGIGLALAIAALMVLMLGLMPGTTLGWAQQALLIAR